MTKEEQIGKLKRLGDDVIYALIDNPYECPIVINKQGIICFMSRFSKRLIGIDPDAAVGKHIKDVIKETHLHEILKDGKARIADLLYIAGKQQVISRIPLKDLHGRILGAVGKGVLNEAVKVAELSDRIEVMDGQLQYYQKQVSDLLDRFAESEPFAGPIVEFGGDLIQLGLSGKRGPSVEHAAYTLAGLAKTVLQDDTGGEGVQVLGPAPAALSRIRDEFRWQLLLLGPRERVRRVARELARAAHGPAFAGVALRLDANPLQML